MKLRGISFFCFLMLGICGVAQQNPVLERKVVLNADKNLEISYRFLADTIKGFFAITENIDGKVKLIEKTKDYPFKFENNALVITGDKISSAKTLRFVFKVSSDEVNVQGFAEIENYPAQSIRQDFLAISFRVKEEPLVTKNEEQITESGERKTENGERKTENEQQTTDNRQPATGIRFRVQLAAATSRMDSARLRALSGLNYAVFEDFIDNYYKYTIGNEPSLAEAELLLGRIPSKNFKKPFIVAYKDGKRISVKEALSEINGSH